MNWANIGKALALVFIIFIILYLMITINNIKSDESDYKAKNAVIENHNVILEKQCDSLNKVIDSIVDAKIKVDAELVNVRNSKNTINIQYVTDKKHWLYNDSTLYFVREYLSGYTIEK
jgi:hypothetical protein